MRLLALAAAGILLLGAARYAAAQPLIGPGELAFYNDGGDWVQVTGSLEKPAVQKDGYVELLVRSESIVASDGESRRAEGLVLVRADHDAGLHYGDRLLISGALTTPPEYEDFSYRDHLARRGVHSLMPFASIERLESGRGNLFWATMYGLRARGVDTLYRLYPPREAALLAGILLGDESGLSEKVKTAFNDTGTRHIIAISGFNISVIAGAFLSLFGRWLGARRGAWAAGAGIALYTLLVGADAPVVRAAIMGLLALAALQAGRQTSALNALGFSAAAMALANPLVLWDTGFQLSFAATLGLVLYAEPLRLRAQAWMQKRLRPEWTQALSKPVNDYLLLTVAAQVFTLPLLLYYFHRVSFWSLPANVLILPVQPALMVTGGLSVLAGMALQPLGQLLAYFGWIMAAYTLRIVEFFAGLPGTSQALDPFPVGYVIIWFAIVAAVSLPAVRARVRTLASQPAALMLLLTASTIWIWGHALARPDGNLHLTLLDVEGEALLIRTPEGRTLLINGGRSPSQLVNEVSQMIPVGQPVDWVIMAGQRADQIDGLPGALKRLAPSAIAWATEPRGHTLTAISDEAAGLGVPQASLHTGDRFDLGAGAALEVIAAGSRGALLLLHWGRFEALLPLGLDFDQLESLDFGERLGPVDVLLLADSGYMPINPPEWIANLSPLVAWSASNGELPSREILDALHGISLYETSEHGWLQVTTDGNQLWFEVARR